MSINRVMTAVALTGALAATAGCQSTKQALGMTKVVPDEFRVVTMAPLTVPPEYALRPPAPGEPRPQELQPESAARQALLGARQGAQRSEGERILASRAGADRADPLARYVVDDEFGDISYKEKSFADRVMFWRKPEGAPVAGVANGSAESSPIDAATEQERLRALTGGKPIVIARQQPRFKLPGL
ncbi:MAG TPA: DUF3035 domain-containing protein [Caulobacteraceae bacterium]|nr:DUF3035 domain-containing protein [Caulobacteraceae bacterium]